MYSGGTANQPGRADSRQGPDSRLVYGHLLLRIVRIPSVIYVRFRLWALRNI